MGRRRSPGTLKIRVGFVEGVPLSLSNALLPSREPEFVAIRACQVMIDHLRPGMALKGREHAINFTSGDPDCQLHSGVDSRFEGIPNLPAGLLQRGVQSCRCLQLRGKHINPFAPIVTADHVAGRPRRGCHSELSHHLIGPGNLHDAIYCERT